MFAYYIILVYIIQMFDKFALILSLHIAIGIVYRFYVNHDSKYLHVCFVVCAGSRMQKYTFWVRSLFNTHNKQYRANDKVFITILLHDILQNL